MTLLLTAILLITLLSGGSSVDLHFENPDSGFFLRPDGHIPASPISQGVDSATGPWAGMASDGGVIDLEQFTVLDPTRPSLIRATYGPFSTKQTVPARYVIPEFPDDLHDELDDNVSVNGVPPFAYAPHIHQLEVSAHLVAQEVTRARPTVRVLIHGAGARGHHSPHICVTVLVRKDSDVLSASCTPAGAGETGGDATCLVGINLPARWWPPHSRITVKLPRTTVEVSYMVGTASGPQECRWRDAYGYGSYLGSGGGPRVTVQPETPVGTVALTLDPGGYDEISADSSIHVLVPKGPLHPGTTIYAPVYLHPPGNLPALILVIRGKVRNGTRIVGVEASNSAWNLTVEFNQRRTQASVIAMLVDPEPDNETLQMLGLHEVFSWVVEVPPDAAAGDTRVTWSVPYVMDTLHQEVFSENAGRRMNTRLTILKDDIQAVLPIAKSWSVVNTAVLTGRQVSRPMKVLIVSQAGKVADVTLQSSCSCTDEAALKVTASCTSVYLDGSEVRGSHNATVVAKYGQRAGAGSFTVWMPEFPLDVYLADRKLSQMKGWKIPQPPSSHPFSPKETQSDEREGAAAASCSVGYQQTPVEVYGRFVAVDDNSGRESYLLSRKASVRVTELVTHLLRVSDPSVATLDHTILKGRSPGRTEVQVLSPNTGRVIGAREVRVATDKVWINRLHATIISGLTLSLQPDLQITDGYAAITTITPTLTAKYQEGLVDVWVEFSEGSSTALHDMAPESFSLKVTSLDSSVVAVAPSPSEARPRVIAIGHGSGDILQVALKVSRECGPHQPTLATTIVPIKVDLGMKNVEKVKFGDEYHKYIEKASSDNTLSELPIADAAAPNGHYLLPDISHQPAVQARMHPSTPSRVTSLEVGMYVLLAVFAAAIFVFAGSCVVYTYRGKGVPLRANSPLRRKDSIGNDSITNAHDWVWLGRATLERASGIGTSPSGNISSKKLVPLSDLNGNSNHGQNHSWRDYHRFSKGMERSGLTSQMNITNNPGAEMEPLLGNEEETAPGCISSSTFTRPSTRAQRRVTFNNFSADLAKGINSDEECPPVPPHRNIGVSANLSHPSHHNHQQEARGEICPPPIPPHGINVIANPFDLPCARQVGHDHRRHSRGERHFSHQEPIIVQQTDDDGAPPGDASTKFVEVNADDFVRLRGVTRSRAAQVRRATILENPLLSAVLPDNLNITDHLDNLPPTMDYEQLLEYFSNLKESNA